jgi:LuxR family maltose regulon positive regulatory protein
MNSPVPVAQEAPACHHGGVGGPEKTVAVGAAGVVARGALYARLSAGMSTGVTLVAAPAGSGKSVLLRSWIAEAGLRGRTAWVQVERHERDAQHFWLAVVDRLRSAVGGEGLLAELAPAPEFDGDGVVRRLVAELEALDKPVVLVIDDLHELVSPDAQSQLELLLAQRPRLLYLVLASRRDPSLGLHRLRLAGELTELRAADLRMSAEEARQLLEASEIDLSEAAAAMLLARTEGWAAGLRLATMSLAGHPAPERFVAMFAGSERTVADYLLAEVLDRQPEAVRRLLLRTSILERISGSLADRLTGATGSERTLLELEDANAFVVSVDPERSWFRYHSLFADLLVLELRRSEPDAVPALHRAAAEWYAQHGYAIEAIKHAEAAADWQLAGELIGQHGFSISLDGSFATMRALLEPFPPEALANPELAAFLAYGEVIRPSLDTAASYIAVAERHASEVPEERRRSFTAMLATARLTLARWRGDYAAALDDVRPMLEPIEADSVTEVAVANDVRAVALLNLGTVELWSGAGDDAQRHLEEALELSRRNGRVYLEVGCLAHLAAAVGRHSLARERELAAHALELMERFGWTSEPIAPLVLAAMGEIDAWQGRLDDAQAWLDRAERALRPNAEPAKELTFRYLRGVLRFGQGRLSEAVGAFVDAQRLESLMVAPDPLGIQARGLRVHALAQLGDVAGARAILAAASDVEREFAELRAALAAVHLAERDARAAAQVLGPAVAGRAPIIRDFSLVHVLLLDAVAHDALGDTRTAEDDVERALDLAEPDALILPFLIAPAPAPALLARHPGHRTAHAALLASVLDVLAGSAPSPRARSGEMPELHEALTDSELRVLRYLPSNLSAPEIAGEMFLSTSTVKTHMRHIYEKLDAHRRTEAVERARALGLLGPAARAARQADR